MVETVFILTNMLHPLEPGWCAVHSSASSLGWYLVDGVAGLQKSDCRDSSCLPPRHPNSLLLSYRSIALGSHTPSSSVL